MSEEKQESEAPVVAAEKPAAVIVDLVSTDEKKLVYTKSFNVSWRNPDDGQTLAGTFTCKRPTLGDIAQLAILKSEMNGGRQIVPSIDFLNEMIAFLRVTLIKAPDWWNPEEMFTDTLLTLVYDHVRTFQDSFRHRSVG